MGKLYLFKERLKNISLWIKIVVFISVSFAFVMGALIFIGQDVIMNQNGLERRTNKVNAVRILLENEEDSLHKFLLGLGDSLCKERLAGNSVVGGEFFRSKRELLAHVHDLNFISFIDAANGESFTWVRKGNQVISQNYTKVLKTYTVYQQARKGVYGGGMEIFDQRLGEALLSKNNGSPQMVHMVAVPVIIENTIEGVLIAGRELNDKSIVIQRISEQLDCAVGVYAGDQLVASDNNGRDYQVANSRLSSQVVTSVLKEGQRIFSEVTPYQETYLVVYEPLKNIDNKIIGTLMLAIPKSPLITLKNSFIVRTGLLGLVMLILFMIAMYWLHGEVSRPLKILINETDKISRGDLSANAKISDSPKCWVIMNCTKNDCPAYGNEKLRCWFIGGTKCGNKPPADLSTKLISGCCVSCEVLTSYKGNEVKQLADVFNFMVQSINDRDNLLSKANKDLEQQNNYLAAHQQELLAQRESLITLNRELEKAVEQLEKSENIVYTLALAVEAKDEYIRGHSERVAIFAKKLACALDLGEEDQALVCNAAILHDLGKIGISDAILNKTGGLTPEEYVHIQEHSAIGEKICQPLSSANALLPIIRHHHEWYNGVGYPDKLKGDEIPVGARILAIADAFDAMTSDRSYRKGMPVEDALDILRDGAGKQWDPEMILVFEKLVLSGVFKNINIR